MQVPLLDLRAQYAPMKEEILAVVAEICDSQREKSFRLACGRRTSLNHL